MSIRFWRSSWQAFWLACLEGLERPTGCLEDTHRVTGTVPDVGKHGSRCPLWSGIDLDGCCRVRLYTGSTAWSPAIESVPPLASNDAKAIRLLLHQVIVSGSLNRCRLMSTSSL